MYAQFININIDVFNKYFNTYLTYVCTSVVYSNDTADY